MFLSSQRVPNFPEPRGRIRDVGVAAKAPLLQVAVVHTAEHEQVAKRAQVGGCFRAGAQIGVAHDFDQRHAGAVQVDDRIAADAVQVLAGVFFHVRACDADAPGFAVDFDVEVALGRERLLELADLVALGQVRIKVVLAGEDAAFVNRAAERQRRSYGQLYRFTVDDRQRAGQTQTNRANVGVRRLPEVRAAAAEELRLRQQLRVDFQPNNDFVVSHRGEL